MAADKTLIEGARRLAAAKGGGGVGLQTVLSGTLKGVQQGLKEKAKSNKKDSTTGLTPAEKALAKHEQKLKENDWTLDAGGFDDKGRETINNQLETLNSELDEAETALFKNPRKSKEYKDAFKRKNNLISEYKTLKNRTEEYYKWYSSQADLAARRKLGEVKGYSLVDSNESYIETYTKFAENDFSWDRERLDFNFGDKENPLYFKDRADYQPFLVETAKDKYKELMAIQASGLNKTGEQRQQKRAELTQSLKSTFTSDNAGLQMLETFMDTKNGYFPELNPVFADLKANFRDATLSGADRVANLNETVNSAVDKIVDVLIGPVKEDSSSSGKTTTLSKTQKDKNTVVYNEFKDLTNENPYLKQDSVSIRLANDSYATWKAELKKWAITDKDGVPRTDNLSQTFNSLDKLLQFRGFSNVTE
ncbi:hypothetical protein N8618_00065 [bacterium]|nr:hypothetical protein [bacterium]